MKLRKARLRAEVEGRTDAPCSDHANVSHPLAACIGFERDSAYPESIFFETFRKAWQRLEARSSLGDKRKSRSRAREVTAGMLDAARLADFVRKGAGGRGSKTSAVGGNGERRMAQSRHRGSSKPLPKNHLDTHPGGRMYEETRVVQ